MSGQKRILLIDPNPASLESLAQRLEMLGYEVVTATDGAQGAYSALEAPPDAVIADLSMPSMSGAQLCRLLNAEPATSDVPVILRGPDIHRNRFWAEQTGALSYVVKGRMGDLVRALNRGFQRVRTSDGFFTALSEDSGDVRDRVAHYLDQALFASVIAAEVRNLAVCESFNTLFDHLAQFVSQVTNYRWLAVATDRPCRAGLHSRPGSKDRALEEARAALQCSLDDLVVVTDDDAAEDEATSQPLVKPIWFGPNKLGAIALAPRDATRDQDRELIDILSRELGGPLRTASLVEESRLLARHDALTGLFNRRAFSEAAETEIQRCTRHAVPLSAMLLDIDHFKRINDTHGHQAGDTVLRVVGKTLGATARRSDICARWGGEEFIIVLAQTDSQSALQAAERVRQLLEGLHIENDAGIHIPVTASIGVTSLYMTDTLETFLDRADKAMYLAKSTGRNRVCTADVPEIEPIPMSLEVLNDLGVAVQNAS
jgi:diguanylate cyclase (GGDEF)-like protein